MIENSDRYIQSKENNNLYCKQMPKRFMQKCPLCGEDQPAMMRGIVQDMDNGMLAIAHDRGYSFCNCRNIFYTKWDNIDTEIYDDMYHFKYQCEDAKNLAKRECDRLSFLFKKYHPQAKTFFEIGAIHDYVMDNMNDHYDVRGLDIVPHDSKYPIEICNFEDYIPKHNSTDIIWASHVFEHFKDPKLALIKCREMLKPGGLLYIAMPDTFFIDFKGNPYKWDWVVNEHHILWNMEDFIEFAKSVRLDCLYCERNPDLTEKADGTFFWKQDFKVVMTPCLK